MTVKVKPPLTYKQRQALKRKANRPAPIIGRVFYDYAQGKLGVQYQGARGAYGQPEYLNRIALRKVKAIILDGRPDDGPPGAYGKMGFLVGEVAPNTSRIICDNAIVVQWNGITFQTVNEPTLHDGEGRTVEQMATCFVIAGDDPIILATGIK